MNNKNYYLNSFENWVVWLIYPSFIPNQNSFLLRFNNDYQTCPISSNNRDIYIFFIIQHDKREKSFR